MKRTLQYVWFLLLLLLVLSIGASLPVDTAEAGATAADGLLTVNQGGLVVISCADGHAQVNGANPDSGLLACTDVTGIVVIGGPAGDEINLAGVTTAAFPNLTQVKVSGQAGDDLITASDFPDTLLGGDGDDTFLGTDDADFVDGGSGRSFFVEATEPRGPVFIERPPEEIPSRSHPSDAPQENGGFTTFTGITYDTQAALYGVLAIPPDPIAAAGPDHVVSVVNVAIEWFTKDGAQQNSQLLSTFFAPLSPATLTYDPKVIYDQYEDRFVVVTMERTEAPNTSVILLAVSDDSDPNGTWYFHKIEALLNIGGVDTRVDYPGFAIDEEAVYVTANMFTFANPAAYMGARLWIIDKGTGSGFYAGGPATVNLYDPPAAVGQSDVTMQPAHIFGAAPAGTGTWLVRYSGYTNGTNEFLSIIRVDNPLSSPTFSHQFVDLGNIDNTAVTELPDAPQLGGAQPIDTGDRRSLQAVWRDDELWTMTTILPDSGADAGQVTAHWTKVNTFNVNSLALSDQGDLGAEDIAPGTFTFWGSIMVDPAGYMGTTFAGSGPAIYPGAYYYGRTPAGAPESLQATGTLAAGEAPYVLTHGGARNRWGDYSGAALDPADETHFWFYNERALTPGNYASQWGTQFGAVPFNTTGFDFGDLPPGYALDARSADGARHSLDSLHLGALWDADPDGQANGDATGDDSDGTDDEDGVLIANAPWSNGANGASVQVTIGGSGNGCLSGWLDWNEDADFGDADEQIIAGDAVSAGSSPTYSFDVPAGTFGGGGPARTFNARFRLVPDRDGDGSCNDQTAIGLTGAAPGGEVEDHQWGFTPTAITLRGPEAETTVTPLVWLLPALLLLALTGIVIWRGGSALLLR